MEKLTHKNFTPVRVWNNKIWVATWLLCMWAFVGTAQTRYEAENASLSSNVKTNEAWRMTNPSNGGCGYVAGTAGETITFTVNAASAGSYDLDFDYSNTGTPSFKVIVNGSSTTLNPATSGGQGTTATVTHSASLNSGNNTIVIEHVSGWTCYDYMDVSGGGGGGGGGGCTSQSITFNALSNKTAGDPAFNLTGSASSGLNVSYVSSNTGVASISGNTVTIHSAGTTNITASQAGNGTYCAASNVVRSFTVDAAGGGGGGGGGGTTTRYETENASLSGATTEGRRMSNPSNGSYALVNGTAGSTMTYTVNTSSAGSYDIDIAYSDVGNPSFKVIINGSSTTLSPASSGGQSTTAVATHSASLNSGNNTIVIEHVSSYSCYDYIEVTGGSGGGGGGGCTSQSITFNAISKKTIGDPAIH